MPEQTEIVKDCCNSIWNCLKATEMPEQTEIVQDCCNSIMNCLKATEMPEKAANDWVNIANDFDRRTQFPKCIGAVDGKHRIKMPIGSGILFCNYKQFFSILLLALVHANCCFIADGGAVGKFSNSGVLKEFKHRKETGIESTGNPREKAVA